MQSVPPREAKRLYGGEIAAFQHEGSAIPAVLEAAGFVERDVDASSEIMLSAPSIARRKASDSRAM